ncbi:MAG: hypothetical protein FJZ90_20100 [Chloroflexi bacterium]|nr:hypothetical protein [Chloroflexota bacterium]
MPTPYVGAMTGAIAGYVLAWLVVWAIWGLRWRPDEDPDVPAMYLDLRHRRVFRLVITAMFAALGYVLVTRPEG